MAPSTQQNYQPRLKVSFFQKGVPMLQEKLGKKNVNAVPRLEKIVINVGVSAARENIKALDIAADEITTIAGQKATVRKARLSISAFKLRENMPIGVTVTLRGIRMYEFLDKFLSLAVPRIRDFRGLNPRGFDGHGNYNLGLKEQYMFPEVNVEKSDAPRGMNISFVTTANSDAEAFHLLSVLGFPFAKEKVSRN